MDLATFLQQLVNGLSLGSLYALIAIGYTMVYGILRLINFAHGDLIMVSAYVAVMGVGWFRWPWPVAAGVAVITTGFLGVMLELGAYRPLRHAPRISLLISAIAASFFLENLALVIVGGIPRPFPVPAWVAGSLVLGETYIPLLSLVIPVITGVLLAGLFLLLHRTQVGRAMRALAYDLETTGLMGVNVNRVISLAFLVGSLLAGGGGLLWALKYPQINPFMGIMPGLKAFIAAVLGGIGNLAGAVVGGLLLGFLEVMLVALFPAWSGYRDALAFILLIIILLVRPT
ncbi:MAG: branched-chain amino acid ABC transporter permease, partial [Thermodesulfobacteriota bacterium]